MNLIQGIDTAGATSGDRGRGILVIKSHISCCLSALLVINCDGLINGWIPSCVLHTQLGSIPAFKLFDSTEPDVLRLLFEHRPADSQVGVFTLAWGAPSSISMGAHVC